MHFNNPIWVVGKIEAQLYIHFTRRMAELMKLTNKDDQVTVFINSPGGDTHTSLGLYDLIARWERQTVGVVTGRAESGGSLILQACRRRLITPSSTLMLHRSTVEIKGTVENAQAALDKFRGFDDMFYAIYAERSGSNRNRIEEMAHRHLHLDADEALAAGLVDEIISTV